MAFEIRDMSWSLFKNDRREPGSNQPEYTGQGKVDGEEIWVSAWVKETKDGRKYFSGSFKFKNERPSKSEPERTMAEVLDDEIPF